MVIKKIEAGLVWFFMGAIVLIIFSYILFPGNLYLTGRAGSGIGLVGLTVLEPVISFIIVSPENTTYNFGIGDVYNLSLNVTPDFDVDTWWYSLYDLRHDLLINDSVVFTPNTTINAVRWSNQLRVYANHTVGTIVNKNVTFSIVVPNSAPILGSIDDHIYVCENNSLYSYFNATDVDENSLISVDINPKDPFYVSPTIFLGGQTFVESYIISEAFLKTDVGSHNEVISVSDQEYIDTKNVNITIVEINNPPNVNEIGAQTVWLNGSGTSLDKAVDVTDVESGNRTSGNLSFVLNFLNGNRFFDITNDGYMNFSSNVSLIGSYNISVCVTDLALSAIPSNISLCGQNGLNQTTCKNFSLAVTANNRAPTIVSYYPSSIGSVAGTSTIHFNASEVDPDGNIPDAYWYVDGSLVESDIGSSVDEFNYAFGCGVSGAHTVELVVSDGLLTDSVLWPITVANIECPVSVPGAGGGGGGGGGSIGAKCLVNWVCDDWNICQDSELSLKLGIISGKDYRVSKDSCEAKGLIEGICGIQIRNCFDLNGCNSTTAKPQEFQSCYFVEGPSCFDGVKNCHNDGCELLVDCGGPCNPCATCSDKVKNQGETGIDCGGPCPWKCEEVVPFTKKYFLQIILISIILLIILIIIIIYIIKRIMKLKKELITKPRKKKDEI